MSNFITRFAPSPTGFLHIGNLRTAVIAWLYCKQNQGKFILRIDDTDLERSKKEYEDQMKLDLRACGLLWDEEFSQSKRGQIYDEYINYLKELGLLYECFESKEDLDLLRKTASNMKKNFIYDREKALNLSENEKRAQKNKPYWRFKLDHEKKISWNDGIKGEICFDPKMMSDPVVIREDGSFTYLLISVIDDIDMRVSNIIRGEDHISNTASQIQMFEAFDGFKGYDSKVLMPKFAHLPLLKMPEGKISKRIGGFEVFNLIKSGILSISLLNYLMNLGSNLTGSAEPELELNELIKKFDLGSYGKASPNFNQQDLERLNLENIRILKDSEVIKFFEEVFPEEKFKFNAEFWGIYKNNLEKLDEISFWQKFFQFSASGYINFLKSYNSEISGYDEFLNNEKNKLILKIASKILKTDSALQASFEKQDEKTWILWAEKILENEEIKQVNASKKEVFLCLRFFLTGKNFGPCMNSLIKFFGYEKILGIFDVIIL